MLAFVHSSYAHPRPAVKIGAAWWLGLILAVVPMPASGAPGTPAPGPTDAAALTARLDALFATVYPPDEPGAAVRVQRGGQTLLRKGYGMADLELGVPIAPDLVFQLCSITKQFTAVAVLMLAAEGKLDLDAPLGRYVPDYPQPGASATLHQLLTHTAGIPSYTDAPGFWDTACQDRKLDELIATWKDKPLDFPPGTNWHYSNSGYVLLGKVIETVSGLEYARFMEEHIFAPLRLEHTAFGDAARIIPGRVRGYDREDDGYRNTPCVSLSLAHAAGGLLSNVDDMIGWTATLFGTERLLAAQGRDRLLTPALLADGRSTFYACGFEVHTLAGHQMLAHGGGGGGFSTFATYVPDAELTVVVLSNRAGAGPSPQALAQQAAALVLGTPVDEQPRLDLSQAIQIRDPSLLDALAGRYELAPGFIVEVRRENDALMIQPTGQPALRIYPQSESRWFPLEIDAVVEFEGLADGRADGLVLMQGGREMRGKRVE
jgi:D-alanyl-D-alanine carboxypeptidase